MTTQNPGLRWLVAAPISAAPGGRTLDLVDVLDQLGFTTTVDLGPALGAASALPTTLTFPRLRAFSLAAVLSAATPLAELQALSERLGGPPSKRPSPTELLATVARITGEGPLHAALATLLGTSPPEAAPTSPATSTSPGPASDAAAGASLVDDLLAQATRAPEPAPSASRPAAIIEAIVRGSQPAKPVARDSAALRTARDHLDAAVAAAARAALADPAVLARESLWRGLKLLHEQCLKDHGPRVSLVDIDLAGLPQVLAQLDELEAMDRPDAVFVAEPVRDLAPLGALAGQASELMVPLVVSISPEALGCADLDGLFALADAPSVPAAWMELRADEDTRWLAAAVNPVALVSEGNGAARRVLLGAPGLALAALLSASERDTTGLASLARPGAVRAPAVWEPTTGPDKDAQIPTGRFAALRAQGRLGLLGLIALGSPRGGDSLVVAACPVVHAAADAGSLPAQILTGRIVRFSTWFRDQITAGTAAHEVEVLFAQGAGVMLFPNLAPEAASLQVKVDASGAAIDISATVHPAIAGLRLEIQFTLPLRVALA
jgi:hypothetical protein